MQENSEPQTFQEGNLEDSQDEALEQQEVQSVNELFLTLALF